MIGQIFSTLQYFITERIPEVKYISLYNNQFGNYEDNRQFDLPAVLIEILPINFDNLLNQVQYSEIQVNLHIGTEIYNGFDRNDKMQDRSFEHLQLLDKLFIGLNRVNSEELPEELKSEIFIQSGFRRNSVTVNPYNSVINHSVINGSFVLFDYSTVKKYNEIELTDIDVKTWYIPNPPFEGEPQAKKLHIK